MAAATLRRSPWALDFYAESWRQYALCRGQWDEFTGDFHGNAGAHRAAKVAHLCKAHCPVLAHCATAAAVRRPVEIVQAGLMWPAQSARYGGRELPDPGCGPWCASVRGLRRG